MTGNYCSDNKSVYIDALIGKKSDFARVLPMGDIINGMIDWVRVLDLDGNVMFMNNSMKNSVGPEFLKKKCYTVFGRSEPCEICISKMSLRDGFMHEKEEELNGRYFSIRSSPIVDRNNKIFAVVEVLRDITNEKNLQKKIIDQNEAHKKDIRIAKKIQMSLLPKVNFSDRIETALVYRPSDELGGDFFDMFPIDKDHLGIYIADVAGHGIASSLLTVFLKSTFNKTSLSPALALKDLQSKYRHLGFDENMYITVFYAVIDMKNLYITYSNAGHNTSPILFGKNRFEILRNAGIPISNWVDDPEYIEKSSNLVDGDRIFFFTDGIIEARNCLGEQFGEERLLDLVIEKNISPSETLNRITGHMDDFVKTGDVVHYEDDITMALMEIRGFPGNTQN